MIELLQGLLFLLPFVVLGLAAWGVDSFHKDRRRIDREHVQWVEENYGSKKP